MSKPFNPDNFVVLSCKRAMNFTEGVTEKLKKINGNNHKLEQHIIDPNDQEQGDNETEEAIKMGILKTSLFSDQEIRAKLEVSVREKSVHLFQCFRTGFPEFHRDLWELLEVLDMLKRSGATKIIIYLPYLPYQRQEKKTEGREPITAKLIFDLVEVAAGKHYERLVTSDLHAKAGTGFSNLPVDDLITWPLFALYIKQVLKVDLSKVVIVSPDIGGSARARSFAEKLNTDVAIIEKRRTKEGKVFQYKFIGEPNEIAIMIDDIISSGETLVKGADLLYSKGVKKIYAFATHGILNTKYDEDTKTEFPAEKRFYDANIDVVITDSIPEKFAKHSHEVPVGYYASCWKWLKGVLSLTQYYADAVYSNETATSLSEKMDEYEKAAVENTGNILDHLIINQPQMSGVI